MGFNFNRFTELVKSKDGFTTTQIIAIVSAVAVAVLILGVAFLKMRRLFLAFMIGSSLTSTIFALSYLGLANINTKAIENYEYMAIYIPLYYGVFNVLNVVLSRRFSKFKYLSMGIPFLVGGAQGVLTSVYGQYFLDKAGLDKIGLGDKDALKTHGMAFLYYAAVYGIVISFVNKIYLI